jgi:hypothetical protein
MEWMCCTHSIFIFHLIQRVCFGIPCSAQMGVYVTFVCPATACLSLVHNFKPWLCSTLVYAPDIMVSINYHSLTNVPNSCTLAERPEKEVPRDKDFQENYVPREKLFPVVERVSSQNTVNSIFVNAKMCAHLSPRLIISPISNKRQIDDILFNLLVICFSQMALQNVYLLIFSICSLMKLQNKQKCINLFFGNPENHAHCISRGPFIHGRLQRMMQSNH